MRKKNLHNKEQSDKAQAKKDRELRGELNRLKKDNARLTKELQKRESFIPSEPDDMEEVKPSKDVPSVDKCQTVLAKIWLNSQLHTIIKY